MLFKIELAVTLKRQVPDPAAMEILQKLASYGFDCVQSVQTGKLFQIELDANTENDARDAAEIMCMNLFVNHNIEEHRIVSVRKG